MKRKRRKRGLDRRILILFSIMPIGCLLAILIGMLITWYLFPTRFVNARISDLSDEYAQEVVVMAAADFARHNDIERARTILAELNVPNPTQYVALVAEQMTRTNRGPVDEDIKNVVNLAKALGVSTVSMVAYISTPTPIPTDTPLPTATPTNTMVVQQAEPIDNLVEAASLANNEMVTEGVNQIEASTPTPTETTPPTDAPTPAPTSTPVPPTDTPEPTATPVPEVDFVIIEQRLLTKDENGGCAGNHNIFVDVIDTQGNPIRGVQIGDLWNNPGPVTGHKGDHLPGRAEYDLYKNGGYHILVKADPTAGREVTSEVTELLSSDDWKIGIPRLIEGGYCPDEPTCRVLWNSGIFGEGNNSLCWGHYSWKVVFQRTW
jgi:hypothetical protein